jgi:hypothetical protein
MKQIKFILFAVFALAMTNCTNTAKPKPENKMKPPIAIDTALLTPNWYCATIEQPEKPGKKVQRAVGAKGKFWPTGSVLKIGFIGGTASQIAAVKQYAPEWTQHANLKFEFPAAGPYDLRVAFNAGGGAWSYVGTDAKRIVQSSPTINLGWIGRDVICHEFGHAIGLFHEHQNPSGGICWNESNVIRDLSGPPNNWTESMIRFNVLNKFNPNDVLTTAWDKLSIMHYSIPASWVCNGVAIPGGTIISPTDAAFVKTIYPGAQPPTGTVTLSGADVDLIVALLNALQSEIDTTAARFRRSSAQIKKTLNR